MEEFWQKNNWELKDHHFQQMAKMPFKRLFPFIPNKSGLYIIRGPRQVGKSTWLKTILAHFVKKKKACFYITCEDISDNKELSELLKIVANRDLVLLDEISFVKNWDRSIKKFMDEGFQGIIVVTGSHAYDLKNGADRMPGRFGHGGEFTLLPLSFAEFEVARIDAKWSTGNRIKELEAFFRVGGFPTAIKEGGKKADIPVKAFTDFWRWIAGDAVKNHKKELFLKEIISVIAKTQSDPVSFQSLGQKTSVGSHNTIIDYIEFLESCFALKILLPIDATTGHYQFKKNKKIYFRDPFLYWLALQKSGFKWTHLKLEDHYPILAELVAHEQLFRQEEDFGYINTANGEIDFVKPKEWAIEVKWSNIVHNLSKAYTHYIIPNKKIWYKGNFLE